MKFSYNIELKSQSKRLCLLVDDSIDIVSTTYLLEIIVHAMNVFNIIDAYVKILARAVPIGSWKSSTSFKYIFECIVVHKKLIYSKIVLSV